jgi:hypothetical protein
MVDLPALMDFRAELRKRLPTDEDQWIVEGVLTRDESIYTVGYDTKLLSTVFELLTEPLIADICSQHGYVLELSSSQTIYPDFTLTPQNGGKRVAVDVKSSYRRSGRAIFTLGSYTSFLRNGTKNILHDYDEYDDHWIVGFVYSRHPKPTVGAVPLKDHRSIVPAVSDLDIVVARKELIAGLRPGSGNTTNIASIFATAEEFNQQAGPFASFEDPEAAFEAYWRSYPKYLTTNELASATGLARSTGDQRASAGD